MYARRGSETGELVVHIEPREMSIKQPQPPQQSYAYGRHHLQLPPIVNVKPASAVSGNVLHRMRSYDDAALHNSKPAKKARVGGAPGGFLARLLNGSASQSAAPQTLQLPQLVA